MAVKLFIVGLPGSGKSAIARYIDAYVQKKSGVIFDHHRLTSRYNDYPILYIMYKDDNEHKRFVPAEPSGFNVIDFSAFDEALKSLGQWITWLIPRDTQRDVSKRAVMQREGRDGEPVSMCHTESVLR